MTINIICCNCKKKYGEKDDGKNKVVESHGHCEACLDDELEKIREYREKLTPANYSP